MELERLLSLLQAYGVTSYADKDIKLELVNFGISEMIPLEDDDDDDDFEVDFTGATFSSAPEGNN